MPFRWLIKPSSAIEGMSADLMPSENQIFDDLIELKEEDYERAIELCINGFKEMPGVRMVGQFGHISFPGISDIDLMVITEDENYKTVTKSISDLCGSISHGSYLFPHHTFVIPESLIPVKKYLSFEHIVDDCSVLWGDERLLSGQKIPSRESVALTTAIWSSNVWEILLTLNRDRIGLRKMLLHMQTFIRFIALNDYILEEGKKEEILTWGKSLRLEVFNSHLKERNKVLVNNIRSVVTRWIESEWRVQKWWEEQGVKCSNSKHELQVRDTNHKFVRSPLLRRRGEVVLPLYYVSLFSFLNDAFSPYLNFDCSTDSVFISDKVRDAISEYCSAVKQAKLIAKNMGWDPYSFFFHSGEGCFPSPFSLAKYK